jgi:hypothetical protein
MRRISVSRVLTPLADKMPIASRQARAHPSDQLFTFLRSDGFAGPFGIDLTGYQRNGDEVTFFVAPI